MSEGQSAGQRLKVAIHVARARTDITSDMELSRRAGVSYDTLMNWFGDKTTPRPHEVSKVGRVLGVPLANLMAAWEGRPVEPPPLQDAIRELVEEMRRDRAQRHEATIALLEALGAIAQEPGRGRGETPADKRHGRRAGSD